MNKQIFTFLVAFGISLTICAQAPGQGFRQNNGQGDNRPKMEFSVDQFVKELKEFVSQEAQLTPAESAKFFPLLFEMHEKKTKIDNKRRELMMNGWKNCESMTESEYSHLIDQVTKLEVQSKQVEQTYYKKFHSILSWKKIFKVRTAIDRFHLHALRKYQPGGRNHGRPQR